MESRRRADVAVVAARCDYQRLEASAIVAALSMARATLLVEKLAEILDSVAVVVVVSCGIHTRRLAEGDA